LRLDPGDWFNYLRTNEATYLELLQKIIPRIEKLDAVMRRTITPHEKLSVTVQFLATGRNCGRLTFSDTMSVQALGVIIPRTCRAI
jgi:hypothetical protein